MLAGFGGVGRFEGSLRDGTTNKGRCLLRAADRKDIYILLAFAPVCWRRPVSPHWRRPVASLAVALLMTPDW